MQRRTAITALALPLLAACGLHRATPMLPADRSWRSSRFTGHPLAGVVWHVAYGRPAQSGELAAALRTARFRLLGEVHDNPDHHAIQLDLLRILAADGVKPLVAFEQFDGDHDAALQERMARTPVTAEDVADAVRFDRRGWDWEHYRPLVATALSNGMLLRAANLSAGSARRIVREGWDFLGAERIAALRLEAVWSPEREELLQEIIFEGHCRALPRNLLPGMAAAQRARDATMADALVRSGPGGAVLITGNGHARRDLGVPLYLADGSAVTCAVGILEVEDGRIDPAEYVASATGLPAQFDFVCFTPAWDRPDPCEAFRPGGSQ